MFPAPSPAPPVAVAVAVAVGLELVLGNLATENCVVLLLLLLVCSCSCCRFLTPSSAVPPYLPLKSPFSLSAHERIVLGSDLLRRWERFWCKGRWIPSERKTGGGRGEWRGGGVALGEGEGAPRVGQGEQRSVRRSRRERGGEDEEVGGDMFV